MSISYTQAAALCQEIAPLLVGSKLTDIQQTTSRTYILAFQAGTQRVRLLISLQEPYLRFHLITANSLDTKRSDGFLFNISKILNGCKLVGCSLLNQDRILELVFQSAAQSVYKLIVELVPKRPNLFLVDHAESILNALNATPHTHYVLPEKPIRNSESPSSQQTAALSSAAIALYYEKVESETSFLNRKKELTDYLEKALKKAEKRIEDCRRILKECEEWPAVNHEGLLLQANLFRLQKGSSEITVEDWEKNNAQRTLTIDPQIEPHTQVAEYFKRSKKLRAGVKYAHSRLKTSEVALGKLIQPLEEVKSAQNSKELESICRRYALSKVTTTHSKPAIKEIPKPYRTYTSESGIEIWVGKSAKDNDSLSFRYAHGSDWWLHARDYPGSHVVIRGLKGVEPDIATLHDAGELALRFSKYKGGGQAEVSVTQVKWLKPVKGCPGKVQLTKHRVLKVDQNEQRWNRLKGVLPG